MIFYRIHVYSTEYLFSILVQLVNIAASQRGSCRLEFLTRAFLYGVRMFSPYVCVGSSHSSKHGCLIDCYQILRV